MKVTDLIREARALGLSETAVQRVVVYDCLAQAREMVALCKIARRPELADEYVGGSVARLRERILNDRAAADEALHIDTAPRAKPDRSTSIYEARRQG